MRCSRSLFNGRDHRTGGLQVLLERGSRKQFGNSSIIDAINWILEHEGDPDIDQMPQVPIDIKIESDNPSQEEVKMKLKDIREQAQKKKKEEQRRKEREHVKERIRMGKQLMETKRAEENNERKRIIAFREAEKEEERRAREKIRWQLEQDKAERRRKLGLPPENPGAVKPTAPPIQEGNVLKSMRPVRITMEETMKDCLRSLKKNHKDDDAKLKKAFQTLLILVGNVARNPDNEKYRKIRLSNPIFQDRVGKFKEGIEFLELCGFKRLEGNGFLYMPRNKVEMIALNSAGLALNSATTNPFFGLLSL